MSAPAATTRTRELSETTCSGCGCAKDDGERNDPDNRDNCTGCPTCTCGRREVAA